MNRGPGTVVLSVLLAALASLASCASGGSFEDPDPGGRLIAIRNAVETNDRSSIPHLIRLLDSDDPAVRLFSIQALEKFTGQTLGYDHAAAPHDRRLAAERWALWYQGQVGAEPPSNG